MTERTFAPRAVVIGPLGEQLRLECLPKPDETNLLPLRKAQVIASVVGGLLSVDAAKARYGLSTVDFSSWQRTVDRCGMQGLRLSRVQN